MKLSDGAGADLPKRSGLFTTTHWSVVLCAKDKSFTALDTLFNQYRNPMVRFLLIQGRTQERAEDLVQGFCAKLLKPDRKYFLTNVSPQKGRFRTFLLAALKNYILDEYDKEFTLMRGEGIIPASLDEVDSDDKPVHSPASSALSADLEFDRDWAKTIIRNSLNRLEKDFADREKEHLFTALEPNLLAEETSLTYRDIAARLGMTEAAVKQESHRMKRKLRELIDDELMQSVSNEVEFNEERKYLRSILKISDF